VAWPLLVCLLSLAGIPPLVGFFSRLYLFSAAVEADSWWLAALGALSSVIGCACYWKIIYPTFAVGRDDIPTHTAPRPLSVALWVAVIGILASAILADPLLALFRVAAQALAGGR
jgi:NADH-quinone oxidoreductase subunit N